MNNIKTIEIKSQIAKSYLVNICLFSVFIYVGEEKLNKSTLKIQTFWLITFEEKKFNIKLYFLSKIKNIQIVIYDDFTVEKFLNLKNLKL